LQTKSDTRQILFIADDFGMSTDVNAAIMRAHLEGALHGACLMMGQPGTEEAIDLARAHASLQIGWHLHLNDSEPMTIPAWPWGRSPARAGLSIAVSPRARSLARAEIDSQWRALRDSGLDCRFVNAHHHLHWHPYVRRHLVETLAADGFEGWMRWGRLSFMNRDSAPFGYALIEALLQEPQRGRLPFRQSTTLWGLDSTFCMDAMKVAALLPRLGDGLHEFMFHPRAGDADVDTRCLIELRGLVEQA
jgi:predicted glycoside hydrolase/deacetylase ChbG (UPF0249 family)